MEKFKKKKYLQFLVYHSPLLLSSIIPNHPNFPSITKLITLHTHTHTLEDGNSSQSIDLRDRLANSV